jgi:hypothetical protein
MEQLRVCFCLFSNLDQGIDERVQGGLFSVSVGSIIKASWTISGK